MADTYKNYADLSANEVEGKDYQIIVKDVKSETSCITPHGGSIEAGASELIEEVAGDLYNQYRFEGIKSSGNTVLHITSANFDEPRGLDLMATSKKILSFHGASGTEAITYVGGKDKALRQRVIMCLRKGGFRAEESPPGIGGESSDNLINKSVYGMGCQLEITTYQRQLFFKNNNFSASNRVNKTDLFYQYSNCLKKALNDGINRTIDSKTTVKMSFKQSLDSGKGALGEHYISTSKLEQKADEISTEVKKKVGKSEVVSSINQSAEQVKIKANKIQLEGLITNGVDGKRIEIQNEDYRALHGDIQKLSMGFKKFGDYAYDIPALYLGANGMNYSQANKDYDSDRYYLKMLSWGKTNPSNNGIAYGELTYNTKFDDVNEKPLISNIRLKGDGDINITPVRNLDIKSNFKQGALDNTSNEKMLARFTTSSLSLFNAHLQIGAVANHSNHQGLVLSDRYYANAWEESDGQQLGDGYRTSVAIKTLSDGTKTFRPATGSKDIINGTMSYPWKSVHALTFYSGDGIVSEEENLRTRRKIPFNEVIDNIQFITTADEDSDNELIIDVTSITGTDFAKVCEETKDAYINQNEIIKLLLLEVKELKSKVKELESRC